MYKKKIENFGVTIGTLGLRVDPSMLAGISIFHPLTHIYATAFTILYGS
jgi:hypothetical protein